MDDGVGIVVDGRGVGVMLGLLDGIAEGLTLGDSDGVLKNVCSYAKIDSFNL